METGSSAVQSERFQLLSLLGQGGMGTVYAAFDRMRGGPVALKTIGASGGKALLRFKREFRAIRELRHPNIVRLGELFESDSRWQYTMELVEGVDLIRYVRGETFRHGSGSSQSVGSSDSNHSGERRAAGRPLSEGGPREEARLRQVLPQLVDALRFLHVRDRLHCDVKPSNVLVTRDGRVVLLDFGLVALRSEQPDGGAVGTVAYMAPEQANGQPATPASDFYALGVMLYEALTGRLPFEGTSLRLLMLKGMGQFQHPSELGSGLPRDLCELCADLLETEPARRPSAEQLLERLSARASGHGDEREQLALRFHGRDAELAILTQSFEHLREKLPRTVLITGPSGFGKTALVEAFAVQLESNPGGRALVLRGRCRPYEEVGFNAFDALVDQLSAHLRSWKHLPSSLPREQIVALRLAFPVLERIADAGVISIPGADARQLRAALHEGFRTLLRGLSVAQPVVLILDDAQWADADSWALLHEVTREPLPPALLVLLTARPEVHERAQRDVCASRVLRQAVSQTLEVGPLSDRDARHIAGAVLGSSASSADVLELLVREGRGNPLLLTTLLRSPRSSNDTTLTLAEVLERRVLTTTPLSRRLAQAVSLAGAPLSRDVLTRALGVSRAELSDAIDQGLDDGLLRLGGAGTASPLEPYHDQLREAALGTFGDRDEQRLLHRALASALESEQAAHEQALHHYRALGDAASITRCAELAGDGALRELAFERAIRLFDEALSVVMEPRPRSLLEKRAEALSLAGRGQEAAEAYLELLASVPRGRATELRKLAALHLLAVGEVERGKAELAEVLRAVGLSLPGGTASTLLRVLWLRVRLRARGMRIVIDGARSLDRSALLQLETCASAAYVFSVLDPILGTYFSTQHTVLALSSGDLEHAIRALSTEGGYRCLMGNVREGTQLMERARQTAATTASPQLKARLTANEAAIAWATARFDDALRGAREAHHQFSTQCQRVTWELVTLELVEVSSLFFLGRYRSLAERVPACLRAAEQRGDHYGITNMLVSQASVRFLMKDQPEALGEAIDEGMRTWPSRGFDMHHLMALQLRVYGRLYEGDDRAARALFEASRPALRRSLLMRLTAYRVLALYLECQVRLATWEGPSERAIVQRLIRKLERQSSPLAEALARCTALALDFGACRDAREQRAALAATSDSLDRAGLRGHLAALRIRAAESPLFTDDERRELAAQGLRALLRQGVAQPERFARILCPPLLRTALAAPPGVASEGASE